MYVLKLIIVRAAVEQRDGGFESSRLLGLFLLLLLWRVLNQVTQGGASALMKAKHGLLSVLAGAKEVQ